MTPEEAQTLAHEAQKSWGGTNAPVLLKLRENAVFQVTLPDVGKAALRLHRRGYQSADSVWSELWWTSALADQGLAVPRPLVAYDGEWVVHLGDGRIASMVSWVEGTPLGEAGTPLPEDKASQMRLYASLGHLLAELHVATDRLTLPPTFQRPHWDIEGLVGESPLWGRFWDHPEATTEERYLLKQARDVACEKLADYAGQGADQGLIHADVLRENVMIHAHRAALIDFDDGGFGFRMYDLATALSQNLQEPHLAEIALGLTEGYGTIRPLSDEDHAMLPWFTLLRCLASVGWTIPRYDPKDPVHRTYLDRALRAARIVLSGDNLFDPA